MNLWVDVSRPPPDGWAWAKTSAGAIDALCFGMVERLSLDHNLDGDDATRLVILWMHENRMWPQEIRVHSADPVDVECLTGMIDRYRKLPVEKCSMPRPRRIGNGTRSAGTSTSQRRQQPLLDE